jgi:protein-S-isoprenylcysteine O-methyltransferase Ste14
MDTQSDIPHTENHPRVVTGILKRSGSVAILLVVFMVILFLAAGRLNWTWAWIYLAVNLVTVLFVGLITIRNTPETVAERGEFKLTKGGDRILPVFYLFVWYIALPLVAGLDARFGWARALSIAWHVAGAVVFAAGMGSYAWAMMANAYFSCTVRIQSDRGHAVCSTGPYRFVRHPGYL